MLRKNIHFLYGGGIGILLVAVVIVFNHYQNSQSQEPVKIYKGTVPSKQAPKKVEPTASPEIETQPEPNTVDDPSIKEPWDTEMAESVGVSEEAEFTEPTESLPATKAQEASKDDPKIVLLKEVFAEFDRLKRESDELLGLDMEMQGSLFTPEEYAAFIERHAFIERTETLLAAYQDACRRITEQFTGAVTFITHDEGGEIAYNVDFQVLQDSLEEPIPSEFDRYFRYASLAEMLGFPEVPPEELQQLQPTRR